MKCIYRKRLWFLIVFITMSILLNSNVALAQVDLKQSFCYVRDVKTPEVKVTTPGAISIEPKAVVKCSSALYTHSNMINDINYFTKNCPYAKSISIGKSILNRDIKCIIIGNEDAENKILICGSTHAREYMATQLIMKQIEYILVNYDTGTYKSTKIRDMFNNTVIYFVPMLNPDGVTLCQSGLSSVNNEQIRKRLLVLNKNSKNFKNWKANIYGVDLNRNFNASWSTLPIKAPSANGYKGAHPESEPESIAVANLIRDKKFKLLVSYHTSGSIIYWYNGQAGNELARDTAIATGLASITNYKLVPKSKSFSYGGLKDWYIPTFKCPGFTIEIGKKSSPVSISEFNYIWNKNKTIPLYLASLYFKKEVIPADNISIYSNLVKVGNDYMLNNNFEQAIISYDTAISLNTKMLDAQFNKSIALYKLQKYDEALNVLNYIISKDANYSEAYYNIACIYAKLNDADKCILNLTKAIELNGNFKISLKNDTDFDSIKENKLFIEKVLNR